MTRLALAALLLVAATGQPPTTERETSCKHS